MYVAVGNNANGDVLVEGDQLGNENDAELVPRCASVGKSQMGDN